MWWSCPTAPPTFAAIGTTVAGRSGSGPGDPARARCCQPMASTWSVSPAGCSTAVPSRLITAGPVGACGPTSITLPASVTTTNSDGGSAGGPEVSAGAEPRWRSGPGNHAGGRTLARHVAGIVVAQVAQLRHAQERPICTPAIQLDQRSLVGGYRAFGRVTGADIQPADRHLAASVPAGAHRDVRQDSRSAHQRTRQSGIEAVDVHLEEPGRLTLPLRRRRGNHLHGARWGLQHTAVFRR